MKIQLKKKVSIGQDDFEEGTVLENPDKGIAESLLGVGWAVLVVEETKIKKPEKEK